MLTAEQLRETNIVEATERMYTDENPRAVAEKYGEWVGAMTSHEHTGLALIRLHARIAFHFAAMVLQ